ncbi:MAG: LacI family DNA-binding transcriptional regulator [Microbacterium sp.]
MPVPLAIVAAEAGVSVATVSKVLNSRSDISEATRARVSAVLAAHGHEVRPRRPRETGLFDVRIVNLEGAWAEAVVLGAAAAAKRHGKDLVLTVDPDADDCDGWVRHALSRGTDGLLSIVAVPTASGREALAREGVPFVAVDPLHATPPGTLVIASTNYQGAFDATRHLLELGHRRIATITGPVEQDNALARLAGYQAALLQAGLPDDADLIIRARYGITDGYESTKKLLQLDERPTAIFAASDDTAIGAIRAIREAGLHVPDDLSVIGFDDVPYARWTDPPLSTIRQPLKRMGNAAVEMLARARDGRVDVGRTELATTLVARTSTGPGPAAARRGANAARIRPETPTSDVISRPPDREPFMASTPGDEPRRKA